MKGIKASLAIVVLTILICIALIVSSGAGAQLGLKKTGTLTGEVYASAGIIVEEGTFAPDIYYEYANNKNIYHVKYDNRSAVNLYNIDQKESEVLLTPLKSQNKIHAFCKSSDYFVWEEDELSDEPEKETKVGDWGLYLRKGNQILKIDESKSLGSSTSADLSAPPQSLSAYENYLVYKSYGEVPGASNSGAVIKLYDMKNDKSRIIFSLIDTKNIEITEPYIYKNFIAWSTSDNKPGENLTERTGDIYIYNINTSSYSKFTEGGNLLNPILWEDYIICSRYSSKGPSLVVINMKTGAAKDIVFSDYSLFPKREIHDYSAGGGYVTWNSSYADLVRVYDIQNDSVIELKECKLTNTDNNSLLNIRVFGKTLLYTDHVFSKKNGKTLTEVNRYIILK